MVRRKSKDGINYIFGYHTQESRDNELTEPIICDSERAWLGTGYYFWLEEKFAHFWGTDSKKATGFYDVYTSWIESDDMINATFNEEGYFFWKERIEKAIEHLKNQGFELNLAKVHEFLADNVWKEHGIKGIIFDDLPNNSKRNKERVYSEIPPLYYEKRLQLVIFDTIMSHDFATFYRKLSCNGEN